MNTFIPSKAGRRWFQRWPPWRLTSWPPAACRPSSFHLLRQFLWCFYLQGGEHLVWNYLQSDLHGGRLCDLLHQRGPDFSCFDTFLRVFTCRTVAEKDDRLEEMTSKVTSLEVDLVTSNSRAVEQQLRASSLNSSQVYLMHLAHLMQVRTYYSESHYY